MAVYNRYRLHVQGYRQFTVHIFITLAALSMQYIIFSLEGQKYMYKRLLSYINENGIMISQLIQYMFDKIVRGELKY